MTCMLSFHLPLYILLSASHLLWPKRSVPHEEGSTNLENKFTFLQSDFHNILSISAAVILSNTLNCLERIFWPCSNHYFIYPGVTSCGVTSRKECSPDQFKCKNENKNQILSINDFNKEKEKCIPSYYRCDGRFVQLLEEKIVTATRKLILKIVLDMTARMGVMKMIAISATSKWIKSSCKENIQKTWKNCQA